MDDTRRNPMFQVLVLVLCSGSMPIVFGQHLPFFNVFPVSLVPKEEDGACDENGRKGINYLINATVKGAHEAGASAGQFQHLEKTYKFNSITD